MLKRLTGINRQPEMYEKLKPKSFCVLICNMHLMPQTRLRVDPFRGGTVLSWVFKIVTASGEKRGSLKAAVLQGF